MEPNDPPPPLRLTVKNKVSLEEAIQRIIQLEREVKLLKILIKK